MPLIGPLTGRAHSEKIRGRDGRPGRPVAVTVDGSDVHGHRAPRTTSSYKRVRHGREMAGLLITLTAHADWQ
jgi:hypothetical protein